ncbi:SURF1 family protein [Yoonia maritima]|uniref:SURF1 family protein n=1 Tax=Yoonia maritima TaxID=1435347 RepID=UPI000D104E22|nr:SURF1 family protein [Yoonia maritima]
MPLSIRWPRFIFISLVALVGIAGFSSLGVWQIQRLYWKRDLIERVDSRIHAVPIPAPGPTDWSEQDAYRRVIVTGRFLHDEDVLIYTPSDYGPADWILTPLVTDTGMIIMVNRGVVPDARARAGDYAREDGTVTVAGLLRVSEDKGWLFSRENDPANGHWYRRDIGSITTALGYDSAAPYFVDQERGAAAGWPRGGQTVVYFRNAHLSYALTWFALAGVVFAGYVLVLWGHRTEQVCVAPVVDHHA